MLYLNGFELGPGFNWDTVGIHTVFSIIFWNKWYRFFAFFQFRFEASYSYLCCICLHILVRLLHENPHYQLTWNQFRQSSHYIDTRQ